MKANSDYTKSVEYDLSSGVIADQFLENCQIGSMVYSGTFSQIYKLFDKKENKTYILKAIPKELGLVFEMAQIHALNHPQLPKIMRYTHSDMYDYIVKEYVEGVTLSQLIHDEGPINETQAYVFLKQLTSVIRYLHAPERMLVFRDIKPANIIIDGSNQLFLLDIESLRRIKQGKEEDTVKIASRGYAAPEQYGYAQTDHRSDIYSIGATLYFMVTGEMPSNFYNNHQNTRFASLSNKTQHLIKKCMALDPGQRFQSIDALEREICKPEIKRGLHKKIVVALVCMWMVAYAMPSYGPVKAIEPERPLMTQVELEQVEKLDSERLPGEVVNMGEIFVSEGKFSFDVPLDFDLKEVYGYTDERGFYSLHHSENDFDGKKIYEMVESSTGKVYAMHSIAANDYFTDQIPHRFIIAATYEKLEKGHYTFTFKNYPTPYGYLNGVYVWQVIVE